MDRELREHVWDRAGFCCEYCQMPQEYAEPTHQIDHVIAEKHRGSTQPDNLALACFHCNNHKGPNISGRDPETDEIVRLYHPRQDFWSDHFAWHGAFLVGRTPVGRATIAVLEMNLHHRILHRQALIEEGVFPPTE